MNLSNRTSVGLAFLLGACAASGVQQSTVSNLLTQDAVAQNDHKKVLPMKDAKTVEAPSKKATLTHLAKGKNAFLGRLTMAPSAKVPEHRDATEEYIHILEGSGVMFIDNEKYTVQPGTTVYMPANAKVQFENGDEKLVAIQVFAGPSPARKYDKWTPLN